MNINKFTNSLDDTSLHSSGFADVASSSQIGARKPQTFNQRLGIERNRQSIGRYHDSMLANGHHRNMNYQRLGTTSSSSRTDSGSLGRPDSTSRAGQRPGSGLISDVSRPVMRPNFTEPPARGYNPYQ